jgi:hypothetical protein
VRCLVESNLNNAAICRNLNSLCRQLGDRAEPLPQETVSVILDAVAAVRSHIDECAAALDRLPSTSYRRSSE